MHSAIRIGLALLTVLAAANFVHAISTQAMSKTGARCGVALAEPPR